MTTVQQIGHYEITELLGEGGIGQVHAARDTMIEREVAIKSLRPELAKDKSFVDRFRSEANSLAKLTHPNITTLYSLLPEGGNMYMIMELVRGRTLEDVMKSRPQPFAAAEALAIVGQAADGLAYAHSMGVVHRDVKPANLMITSNGTLKIMDFGIARVQGSQRMTRAGSAFGTPEYMSPEQVKGQDVDGRCDQYSLAIVLYEMLTGRVPFAANSDYELGQMHINATPERPSRQMSGIDPSVEKALLRALSKRPEDRFDSMGDFKAALGSMTSMSEAQRIVAKSTRIASLLSDSSHAVTSAVSQITSTAGVNKSSIPFALKGVMVGAGAAVVVAAVIVLFLGPSRSPAPSPNVAGKSEPQPGSGAQAVNPNVIDARVLGSGSTQNNPNFIQVRPAPSGPGSSGKPVPAGNPRPFDGAAEPSRPAAQPPEVARAPVQATAVPPTVVATATATPAATAAPVATATPAATATPSQPQPLPVAVAARPESSPPQETSAGDQTSGAAGTGSTEGTQVAAGPSADQAATGAAAEKKPTQDEAISAYQQKNYQLALQLSEPFAKSGCVECQFIMGRLYETGNGGKKDPLEAANWYKKAAEGGFNKARHNLALMYLSGRGVLKDPRAAAELLFAAASKGDGDSALVLAQMYEKGEGITRDRNEALRWYEEASKSSDTQVAEEGQTALERLDRRRKRR